MENPVLANSQSTSGLQFNLHPLVLINVSDHYTRTLINDPNQSTTRVIGCLLGQQSGRAVEITNSFELKPPNSAESTELDVAFTQKKLEQYKQTFPGLDLLGWYATGNALGKNDMKLHRKFMEFNESPVLLLLDPSWTKVQGDDLPVKLFESELHVEEQNNYFVFVNATYSVVASDAERIGVDQITKILPSGGSSSGSSQVATHVSSVHSAGNALALRVEIICSVLRKMQAGTIPFDAELARECAGFAHQLSAIDSSDGDFAVTAAVETCDALLGALLAGITEGTTHAISIVDKHNLAFEKIMPSKRAGKGTPAFGPML